MGNENSSNQQPLEILQPSNQGGFAKDDAVQAPHDTGLFSESLPTEEERALVATGSSGPRNVKRRQDERFVLACRECFARFDRNRDGRLSLADALSLAGAVCEVWQVPLPTEVARSAFERRCGGADHVQRGLARDAFDAWAEDLVTNVMWQSPGAAVDYPSISDVLAARGRRASSLLLQAPLPTAEASLSSMGATGVAAMISEVRGLAGGAGALCKEEEQLCCVVVVQREGRLLPRRCTRSTALADCCTEWTSELQPKWIFEEELLFDEPTLIGRRGELCCRVLVRRGCDGPFARVLAVAENIPVPTAGETVACLADPATGCPLGEVHVRLGWSSSPSLSTYIAADIRRDIQRDKWAEARNSWQSNGAEAAELVASVHDVTGRTLLMWAASSAHGTAFVRDLLAERTASRFAVDNYDATAVHYAAWSGSVESLAALLGSGVSANAAAQVLGGATPLMLAALRNSQDHVRLLLGHGAKPQAIDCAGLPAAAWTIIGSREIFASRPAVKDWAGSAAIGSAAGNSRPTEWQWSHDTREVVMQLLDALWSASPLDAREASASQGSAQCPSDCGAVWLAVAEQAAQKPDAFDWLVREFLRQRCSSASHFKSLVARLFDEALQSRCETLAVKLVDDLAGYDSNCAIDTNAAWVADSSELPPPLSAGPEIAFGRALEAGMPNLAFVVLMQAEGPCLGPPSRAVRALQLAHASGHADLTRAVLGRLPLELPRDAWQEPAVLSDAARCECPVCFQTICQKAVALCTVPPSGEGHTPACCHLICFECSQRLSGQCPLCRAAFSEITAMPDPGEDPMAWFEFAAGRSAAGAERHPAASEGQHASFASSTASLKPPETRSSPTPSGPWLTRADVQLVLPATLHVDPRLLGEAFDRGLWRDWDADGDGTISRDDYFEPSRGLLRWLLVHLHEHRIGDGMHDLGALDVGDDAPRHQQSHLERRRWFAEACWRAGATFDSGLSRGDVLREVLQSTGTSSLDHAQVEEFRCWVMQSWTDWVPGVTDGSGCVAVEAFCRSGGLADALVARTSMVQAERAVQRLRSPVGEPCDQVEALSQLARCAAQCAAGLSVEDMTLSRRMMRRPGLQPPTGGGRLGLLYGALVDDASNSVDVFPSFAAEDEPPRDEAGVPLDGTSSASSFAAAYQKCQVASCTASERVSPLDLELQDVLYREALPALLSALERRGSHVQIVAWSCRALVALALLASAAVSGLPANPSWTTVIREALCDIDLRMEFDKRVGREGAATAATSVVARAVAALCASPGVAAIDVRLLRGAVGAAAAVLRLFAGRNHESRRNSFADILEALPSLDKTVAASRALVGLVAFVLSADLAGIAEQFDVAQRRSHAAPPFWVGPPSALPSASVEVGQNAEVCCHGGWYTGTVVRAPLAEPSSPRDECWVVACGGETRVFSRHVWAVGWRNEATQALGRMASALQAHLLVGFGAVPAGAFPPSREERRSLLNGVIIGGLAPRASSLDSPQPCGTVLRGGAGAPVVRQGDKVCLSVSVERAKSLQSQRYGDWSEQMAFCLDCAGRVVDCISGPPRAVISHGGLGTFIWNPLVITHAEQTCEPLPFEELHGPLVVGDEVLLCAEQERAVPLQTGHGGWSTRMGYCLGRYGRIASFNNRGDIRVDTQGFGAFLWNPEVLEPPGKGSVTLLCANALQRLDDEGAATWLLLLLAIGCPASAQDQCDAGENREVDGGRVAIVEDVLDVLHRAATEAASQHGVPIPCDLGCPPRLRAFGALALLAAATDLPQHLSELANDFWGTGTLPDCASPDVLSEIRQSHAMQWPAKDTGGISVAEVVNGTVGVAEAAQCWLLAFFSSRRQRLLVNGPLVAHDCTKQ